MRQLERLVHNGKAVFILSMVLTSMFYVLLLRHFGALPVAVNNRMAIHELHMVVDSLRNEVRNVKP